MSGPVRDQGRRRRSQTYAGHKSARSSKLSLLTAITSGSHGSTGSSSTVTQESYSKSTSSPSKRSRSSRPKRSSDERRRKASPVKTDPKDAAAEKNMSRESVDVFAFLVKDDDQGAADSDAAESDAAESDAAESDAADSGAAEEEPHAEKDDSDNESTKDDSDSESIVPSMHSDSGISMGDSIVHSNNDPFVDTHLPPLLEDVQEQEDTQKPREIGVDRSQRLRWKYPEVPQATHKPPTPALIDRTPSPVQIRARMPQTPDGYDKEYCLPRNVLSGYDLIADKLASGELPPVFRNFKKIYFRLLLQLQDEIIEMEEQLAALDSVDGRSRLHPDGTMSPASRRLSWQWGQSDVPAHRLHVLGRLSMKLEQYCTSWNLTTKDDPLTGARSGSFSLPASPRTLLIPDSDRDYTVPDMAARAQPALALRIQVFGQQRGFNIIKRDHSIHPNAFHRTSIRIRPHLHSYDDASATTMFQVHHWSFESTDLADYCTGGWVQQPRET
ncbi:hypothetical protein FOPE_11714 [Fonsecaea pedrosoi]|nr:hypothetical protein FOPE_11714 [Fonsecaea pedrosoi]